MISANDMIKKIEESILNEDEKVKYIIDTSKWSYSKTKTFEGTPKEIKSQLDKETESARGNLSSFDDFLAGMSSNDPGYNEMKNKKRNTKEQIKGYESAIKTLCKKYNI
jgi:hypothetical protein